MDQENIIFFKNQDESYIMIDLHLYDRFFVCKSSYNYHIDKMSCWQLSIIDVDKILLFKKCDGNYFIRYNDVYYAKIIPLELIIDNFYGEIDTYASNNRVMFIYSDDKELFEKCWEIRNRINKLIGINNAPDFVRTGFYNDEFIMVNVQENTSFVNGNYTNEVVIVLDSVFNNYAQASLIQVKRKHKCIH